MIDHHTKQKFSRRDFLTKTSLGLGAVALSSFSNSGNGPALIKPHHMPSAKRVIYLFQSGAPSQIDLFDHKPLLQKMHGQELPESVRSGQRLTGMTSGQNSFPLVGSPFAFRKWGQSGTWVSKLMPHTAKIVDGNMCS